MKWDKQRTSKKHLNLYDKKIVKNVSGSCYLCKNIILVVTKIDNVASSPLFPVPFPERMHKWKFKRYEHYYTKGEKKSPQNYCDNFSIFFAQFIFIQDCIFMLGMLTVNPLRASFTKWSNRVKQIVSKLPTNCLSVFDHFVGLALKGLILRLFILKSFKFNFFFFVILTSSIFCKDNTKICRVFVSSGKGEITGERYKDATKLQIILQILYQNIIKRFCYIFASASMRYSKQIAYC